MPRGVPGAGSEPATQVDTLGRLQLDLFIPDVKIGGVQQRGEPSIVVHRPAVRLQQHDRSDDKQDE